MVQNRLIYDVEEIKLIFVYLVLQNITFNL
jgi:hypothetical protein